jgi:hypothetical protein
MRLPPGAVWPLGQTRCRLRGSSLLRTRLQVDGTAMLAEGCHQGLLCYGHSVTRWQRLRPMRLPLQRRPSASMRGWPCTLFAFRLPRHVAHAAHGEQTCRPYCPWCQCSSCQCTNRCKFDKHSLSAVDLRVHGPGLQAAFTEAPTVGLSSVWSALCAPAG